MGLETLAATINEEAVTLEDVYEPYLMQIGIDLSIKKEFTPMDKLMQTLFFYIEDDLLDKYCDREDQAGMGS